MPVPSVVFYGSIVLNVGWEYMENSTILLKYKYKYKVVEGPQGGEARKGDASGGRPRRE